VRPAIGVTAGSQQLHRALKLPQGVAIVGVGRGTPAAQAGLQPFSRGSRGEIVMGDVITAVNDEPVKDLDDMLSVLEGRQSGQVVRLTVWREGRMRSLEIRLSSGE
jgi:S1-C subfamily serine protease